MSVKTVIQGRIAALLARRGVVSHRDLAREMGRSHTWLSRKLDGSRPLNVDDIDELLTHLDEKPEALIGRRKTDPTDS